MQKEETMVPKRREQPRGRSRLIHLLLEARKTSEGSEGKEKGETSDNTNPEESSVEDGASLYK